MSNTVDLLTKEGRELSKTPWNVYPRPLLKRDSFLCLNGEWDFAVCHQNEQTVNYNKKIIFLYFKWGSLI